MKLKPHQVQDTVSVNNVRTTINLLTKPMTEIKDIINENIKDTIKKKKEIDEFEGSIADLQAKLTTVVKKLHQTKLDKPRTVCDHQDCGEKHEIRYIYKKWCHSPCYLSNADNHIAGNTGLLECDAFRRTVRTTHRNTYQLNWSKK